MINEIEYLRYWNDWYAGEAKTRGLLSSDELHTICKYLLY